MTSGSVDLSANYEGRIYDPKKSGIRIRGIRSWDSFVFGIHMHV